MAETIKTVGELAGICGHDGTNWEKILIDASKRLVVAVASAIASDVQVHGHIGGDWQKQPLVFGFSDTVSESKENLNLDAGFNNLQGSVVPAGEIWVVTAVAMMYSGTVPTSIQAAAVVDSIFMFAIFQAAPVSTRWYSYLCNFYLGPGDRMDFRVYGATAGDDLYGRYSGYRMDIDL